MIDETLGTVPSRPRRRIVYGVAAALTLILAAPVSGVFAHYMARNNSPAVSESSFDWMSLPAGRILTRKISPTLNVFGCTDPYLHTRVMESEKGSGTVPFEVALQNAIRAGVCVRFSPGETVEVRTGTLVSGYVQIRRPDTGKTYWVTVLSIK